jgi:two-component system cell cycle response regulator
MARARSIAVISWGAMPAPVRALTAVTLLFIVLEGLLYGTPWLDVLAPADDFLYNGALIGATGICLVRAAVVPGERAVWALVGAALALWTAGNVYWTVALADLDEAPFPSLADAGWLLYLPLTYVAIVLLVRERLPHVDPRLWLDGLIAALATGALSAAVVFDAVRESTGGDAAAVMTNLAYPLGDMILLGTIVGAMAAGRGRMGRTWLCFGAGIAIFTVTDSVYLVQVAEETYVESTLIDLGWLVGALLTALAAWQPATHDRATGDELPSIGPPVVLALASVGLLVYDHFAPTNLLALGLAAAAIVAILVRFGLTHRHSRSNLIATRHQARTDSLTGLWNRLALTRDLDRVLDGAAPHLLLLFDLDGFKNYNDSYGHPAGDALLTRLGSRLAAAVPSAYRIGGDEFCVLAPWPAGEDPAPLIDRARAALTEQGEGFSVGASCGHAALPADAPSAADALRVADRRLYAEKHSGRVSARVQSAGVLRRALDEWDADLGLHVDDVAGHAAAVAQHLGLDEEEVERVATAAQLHDIGKIAIPRSILHKAGPLDEDEWAFMHRHTLIGERIVQGAPALAGVAGLIRSSHERWDGRGYPDGLAGDEIPLGAQIVLVCDAFAAMTTARSYKAPLAEADALAELRDHAGTQFAPAVVAAFLAVYASRAATAA